MDPGGRRRTAVMVIKVWLEQDGERSFLARITESTDLGEAGPAVTTCGDPEQLLQHIEEWLRELT
ncbi:hypothetical protein [Microlunatus sp. Gsoil 973]|uniref:hypothetical protein n=1 Tax=Microlunatus sp. Gsoil 973 TaxID=2672569 RepID=UPI0012B44E23|nr:hypothetical protein [Microlunatus sp. Gsoil 973]QGN32415.1 hypothetical protein GJV80_05950 [Microlunatus sp. Gsoil 973]